jgi:hypothetical protein
MTTIAYVAATGLSLIVISWCALFIVMSYARATIRGASERATRAGSVAFTSTRDNNLAVNACNSAFQSDMDAGLPGTIRSNIVARCVSDGTKIQVFTSGNLGTMSVLFPTFTIDETTTQRYEDRP